MLKKLLISTLLCLTISNAIAEARTTQECVEIGSIEQLLECATKDNQNVTMRSGVYYYDNPKLGVIIPLTLYGSSTTAQKSEPTKRPITTYIHFSGSNNRFNMEGVTIILDSQLHAHSSTANLFELFVTGDNNTITGLSVEDEDSNIAPEKGGAVMLHVMGDNNTIERVNLLVRGSAPYGYGHLLGKGWPTGLTPLKKHSTLLISGCNTKLIGCRAITRGYGHGIFMQGAVNTYIEDCYVEGAMRSTDEMLGETSGAAFDADFKSIYPPGYFEPNRMIALSEDGIRTYPFGGFVNRRTQGVTVINSTVKNMRSGFDMSVHIPPTVIINCEAIECQEKGYSIGSQGVVIKSRGDAKYGPLLTFQRTDVENCYIELELLPSQSHYKVSRLVEISGRGHYIYLSNYNNQQRQSELPIVFGETFWSDVHIFRNPDEDPAKYSQAYEVTLINKTAMPTEFKERSGNNTLYTNGKVSNQGGSDNRVVFE